MTSRTNARVAGFTFLFYIAAGVTGLILGGKAAAGEGVAAKLASIAQHVPLMRVVRPARAALLLRGHRPGGDALRDHAGRGPRPGADDPGTRRTVEGVIGAVSLPRAARQGVAGDGRRGRRAGPSRAGCAGRGP